MKKIVLAMLLVATFTAVAQTTSAPAQAPAPAPAAPAAQAPAAAPQQKPTTAPQQKKEIKDPAEYNAYIGAFGQQDPAAKISGFEAFVTQYPNSVMKEEALEQLMGAYQATGNIPKMVETAQKVVQLDPTISRPLPAGSGQAYDGENAAGPGGRGTVCREGSPGAPDLAQAGRNGRRRFSEVQDPDECDLQRCRRHDGVSE